MKYFIRNSKIITVPEFKPIPPFTDAADVEENIENWLNRGMSGKLESYCIPDTTRSHGYRFVRIDDLHDVATCTQVILGLVITISFKRWVHQPDLSFCPLYFSEEYIETWMHLPDGTSFEYRSDTDLTKKIRAYKKHIKQPHY